MVDLDREREMCKPVLKSADFTAHIKMESLSEFGLVSCSDIGGYDGEPEKRLGQALPGILQLHTFYLCTINCQFVSRQVSAHARVVT